MSNTQMKEREKHELRVFFGILFSGLILIGIYLWCKDKEIGKIFIFLPFMYGMLFAIQPKKMAKASVSIFKGWMKIGSLIGGVFSKIILLSLFVTIFIPVSLLFRIIGRDLLKKKINKNSNTYWEKRETQPGSMERPF